MARKKGYITYAPSPLSGDSPAVLAAALQRELEDVAAALDNVGAGLFLAPHAVEPSKPKPLMVVYADGANWNPGMGEGVYVRNLDNTAWVFFGNAIGTVTSVAMSVPSVMSVTGSPIVNSGTLAISLAAQNSNIVFAGPSSGSATTPTFRALVAADLPAVTIGRHSIPITAYSMRPSVSGGCAAIATIAIGSGYPDISTLNFDASTEESAQFFIPMMKSWNESTITAAFIWSHAATTTNFGVTWGLQAVATSDDDTLAVAFGTAQTANDTGGTADKLYKTSETSAITIAGTPANEDTLHFRVFRKVADSGDTMAIDARLHAVVLYFVTNAETDA